MNSSVRQPSFSTLSSTVSQADTFFYLPVSVCQRDRLRKALQSRGRNSCTLHNQSSAVVLFLQNAPSSSLPPHAPTLYYLPSSTHGQIFIHDYARGPVQHPSPHLDEHICAVTNRSQRSYLVPVIPAGRSQVTGHRRRLPADTTGRQATPLEAIPPIGRCRSRIRQIITVIAYGLRLIFTATVPQLYA
jgi:hypothetical protein